MNCFYFLAACIEPSILCEIVLMRRRDSGHFNLDSSSMFKVCSFFDISVKYHVDNVICIQVWDLYLDPLIHMSVLVSISCCYCFITMMS